MQYLLVYFDCCFSRLLDDPCVTPSCSSCRFRKCQKYSASMATIVVHAIEIAYPLIMTAQFPILGSSGNVMAHQYVTVSHQACTFVLERLFYIWRRPGCVHTLQSCDCRTTCACLVHDCIFIQSFGSCCFTCGQQPVAACAARLTLSHGRTA